MHSILNKSSCVSVQRGNTYSHLLQTTAISWHKLSRQSYHDGVVRERHERLSVQFTYACEQEMKVWTALNSFSATRREQCHQQLLAQISFLSEEDAYKSLSSGHRAANCAVPLSHSGHGSIDVNSPNWADN